MRKKKKIKINQINIICKINIILELEYYKYKTFEWVLKYFIFYILIENVI